MLRGKRDWRGSSQELSCYKRVSHFALCRGVKCLLGRLSAIAGETILWRSLWHFSLEQYNHSLGLTILTQFKKDRTVANQRDPASCVHPWYITNNVLDGAGPSLPLQGRSVFFYPSLKFLASFLCYFTSLRIFTTPPCKNLYPIHPPPYLHRKPLLTTSHSI